MAWEDDLRAARDSIATELKNETARRAALTAAGNPAPVNYSVDGRSVSYTEWAKAKIEELKALSELVAASEPYEFYTRGYSG